MEEGLSGKRKKTQERKNGKTRIEKGNRGTCDKVKSHTCMKIPYRNPLLCILNIC